MARTVLGVDPGYARTGYAVLRKECCGKTVACEYGVWETPSRVKFERRLIRLYQLMKKCLTKVKPDVVVMETFWFHAKLRRNVTRLLQARGVLVLAVAEMELPLVEYSPSVVKSMLLAPSQDYGAGNTSKTYVGRMMERLLNLPNLSGPDDIGDALAIAWCYLAGNFRD